MNCQASEVSGKLDVRQVVWTSYFNWNHCLFASNKNLSLSLSITKKEPLPCIKQTEYDMDSRIKLKIFKEMMNEFRTKNWKKYSHIEYTKQNNKEIPLWGSQF